MKNSPGNCRRNPRMQIPTNSYKPRRSCRLDFVKETLYHVVLEEDYKYSSNPPKPPNLSYILNKRRL